MAGQSHVHHSDACAESATQVHPSEQVLSRKEQQRILSFNVSLRMLCNIPTVACLSETEMVGHSWLLT